MTPPLIAIGLFVLVALGSSVAAFVREKNGRALVQLAGATFLIVVVLTHVAEAFGLFPGMGWGLPDSPGHYIDLVSAVAGLILFPAGVIARWLVKRSCEGGKRTEGQ